MAACAMWDPALRATFAERVRKLNGDTKGAWGKFSASGMLAHLNDSYRMCTGELKVKSKNLPLRYTPIKQLVIYVAAVSERRADGAGADRAL